MALDREQRTVEPCPALRAPSWAGCRLVAREGGRAGGNLEKSVWPLSGV